ncbi:hypothetical protein [Bdellovibrio reynosensis]|uniref:Uncharacterized protein n=1 Tax=Bdellovibrio reynosensis TaxID=2835041 RepID=A0ABY4C4Y8_9BACT|nr:hypothetical protein [Bdellovibrio reynosensis]UOE99798.1 hypothetical protein MNR06_08825 [Bdellovibrio reynosensis]
MSLFKYTGFFVFGAVAATFIGLLAVSYYGVDQVHKASISKPELPLSTAKASLLPSVPELPTDKNEVNPNLRELTRLAKNYASEFNLFDQLTDATKFKPKPELCSVLCNPVALSKERLQLEGANYLAAYYKEQGTRAFQDPLFRIVTKETELLAQVYAPRLREVVLNLNRPVLSATDKLMLAMQAEAAVLIEATQIAMAWDEIQNQIQNRKPLRELFRSCQMGLKPKKQVFAECESLIPN